MKRWLLSVLAIVAAPVIAWAADSYQVNHGTNVNITEHATCRKVTNNHASGLGIFVPTKTSGEWSSFYNSPPAGVTVEACSSVTPGSQTYSTAGSYNFVVPAYNTLTVKVWGGGASGGATNYGSSYAGAAGSASSFNGTVIANGGRLSDLTSAFSPPYGGTASGGDVNQTGGTGAGYSTGVPAGAGGAGASGGAGGAGAPAYTNAGGSPGVAPGGGGGAGGMYTVSYYGEPVTYFSMPAGGGGGYAAKTYAAGGLTVGGSIAVVVGGGGNGAATGYDGMYGFGYYSGNGASGRVTVTWN